MTQHIRLKPSTLQEIKDHTQKDNSLLELIKVIKAGWPETKGELSHLVLPFFDVRDELSVCSGIVIRGERVVVPKSLRRGISYRLHYAHSEVVSTLLLARESIYWPGVSGEIKQFIEMCLRRLSFLMKCPTGHGRKSELTCSPTGVGTISFVLITILLSGKSTPLTKLLGGGGG